MKKKISKWIEKYAGVLIAVSGLAVVAGGAAIAQSLQSSPTVSIQNQTVQGNFIAGKQDASPVADQSAALTEPVAGAGIPSAASSRLTNFRVQGAFSTCEADSSTTCYVTQTETKILPFSTTTMDFDNPKQSTTTFSLLALPRILQPIASSTVLSANSASSTFELNCFATSTTSTIPFNENFRGASVTGTLIHGFIIATNTAPVISSFATGTPYVLVPPGGPYGGRVDCVLQYRSSDSTLSCNQQGVTNACESPTSSNRGLDYDFIGTWGYAASSSAEF